MPKFVSMWPPYTTVVADTHPGGPYMKLLAKPMSHEEYDRKYRPEWVQEQKDAGRELCPRCGWYTLPEDPCSCTTRGGNECLSAVSRHRGRET